MTNCIDRFCEECMTDEEERVVEVRRFCGFMLDSVSVVRQEMARDVLDILDGKLGT